MRQSCVVMSRLIRAVNMERGCCGIWRIPSCYNGFFCLVFRRCIGIRTAYLIIAINLSSLFKHIINEEEGVRIAASLFMLGNYPPFIDTLKNICSRTVESMAMLYFILIPDLCACELLLVPFLILTHIVLGVIPQRFANVAKYKASRQGISYG